MMMCSRDMAWPLAMTLEGHHLSCPCSQLSNKVTTCPHCCLLQAKPGHWVQVAMGESQVAVHCCGVNMSPEGHMLEI